METGQQLSIWCVRLALICFFGFAIASINGSGKIGSAARLFWTLATAFFVAHVIFAFAFFHDFSHDQAYTHTAQRTEEVIGWKWGGGIYFNYLFVVVCLVESFWMWLSPQTLLKRPKWISVLVYGFVVFMIINGAIIFVQGPVRWISLGGAVAIIGLYLANWKRGVQSEIVDHQS